MSGIQFPTGTHEVTTSGFSGTGPFLLAGVPAGTTERRTFLAAAGANAIIRYIGRDNAGNWERGFGRFIDTPSHQVERLSVLASSNAGALVNFPTGSIDVFVTVPMDLFAPGIISISTARTVEPWEHKRSFNVDASGGAVTVTLPAIADSGNGFEVTVKKTDSSSNAVTVATPGAETIDGGASHELIAQNQTAKYVCDGTNWYVAGTVLGSGTQGDIFYANASGAITALAAGTVGYALISGGAGANPSWAKTPTGSTQSSSPGTTVATSTLTATGGTLSVTPTGASRKLHVVMAINCTINASASAGGFKTRPLYVNSSSVNTATSIQKTSHAGSNATATSVVNTMTAVHVFVLASSEVNASGNWEIGQFMANNGAGTATLNNVEISYMEMGE